ncbi:MAG: hypothetical protein MJ188_06115 [Treponema sp.]|nr:hypothetical protein [Treponema sp.]
MKKISLFFTIFLFITNIWGQEFSTSLFGSFPITHDFTNQEPFFQLIADGKYSIFQADGGISITNREFNFTTHGFVVPHNFSNGLSIGYGAGYHHLKYQNIFNQNNLQISAKLEYTTKHNFFIKTNVGVLLLFTTINYLIKTNPVIFSNSWCIEVLMSKQFNQFIKGYLIISSFDYFDYPNLGIPFIKTGVEFSGIPYITPILDYTIKLEDMFTSTTYVSGSYIRLGVKAHLW